MTVDMKEFPSEDENLSENEGDDVSFNNNATLVTVAIDRTSNPFQKDRWSERSAHADSTTDYRPSMSIPQVLRPQALRGPGLSLISVRGENNLLSLS